MASLPIRRLRFWHFRAIYLVHIGIFSGRDSRTKCALIGNIIDILQFHAVREKASHEVLLLDQPASVIHKFSAFDSFGGFHSGVGYCQ